MLCGVGLVPLGRNCYTDETIWTSLWVKSAQCVTSKGCRQMRMQELTVHIRPSLTIVLKFTHARIMYLTSFLAKVARGP